MRAAFISVMLAACSLGCTRQAPRERSRHSPRAGAGSASPPAGYHGIWVSSNSLGQLQHREYSNGIPTEVSSVWYTNGRMYAQVVITNIGGTRYLRGMHWWDSGHPMALEHRLVGKRGPYRHGEYCFWFPNGNREVRGQYSDRKPVGTWTSWYESGSVQCEARFGPSREGRIVQLTVWNETGDVVLKRGVVDAEGDGCVRGLTREQRLLMGKRLPVLWRGVE